MEHHSLVDPVDELRAEAAGQQLHQQGLHLLVVLLGVVLLDQIRAEVGGHDHHCVAEVHGAALTIGQAAIVQHLQQDVEHIRVRLLNLVQQDHRVGATAYRLGEITPLLVAHVSRRRPHQTGHAVLLHELGHVDPHHGVLGIEQELRQRLAQLCLAHPGGPQEQEGADGAVRIGQPGPGAANGVGDGVHRLFLADHPAVQLIFHPQQLVALPFQHPRHRNTGPARQHVCDLHVGDPVAQQAGLLHLRLGGEIQLFLQLGDAAILQLGHAAEIPGTAGHLEILAGLLQRSLDVLGTGKGGLLGLPHLFQLVVFPLLLGQLLVEQIEALAAGVVVLLHQRLLLQLELDDAPLEAVQGLRLGVDLQPYAGRRLVDEVDGLVRQLAIRDVAVGQLGRRHNRRVGDLHMVVQLIALLQAA
ncbi:hypothetical protein D3C73_716520 [compost metagenome]